MFLKAQQGTHLRSGHHWRPAVAIIDRRHNYTATKFRQLDTVTFGRAVEVRDSSRGVGGSKPSLDDLGWFWGRTSNPSVLSGAVVRFYLLGVTFFSRRHRGCNAEAQLCAAADHSSVLLRTCALLSTAAADIIEIFQTSE